MDVPQENNNDSPKQINFTDSAMYKAAAVGLIDPFTVCTEPLNLLLTPSDNTILHIHITQRTKSTNSISFLEHILAKCPSLLLQTNNRGETPLHMAARHGHDSIVKFLIDSAKAQHQDIETGNGAARAMLRMENKEKETALQEAARHNHPIIVQILTAEDPDFTYSGNQAGETPLYLAAERGFRAIVLQILITCSSPAYHGPNGRTALHEAVIRNDSGMTRKILETNKTLVKEVDQQGWGPLHNASHLGHFSIVKQFLESDKSVAYIGDRDGKIPLHLAAAAADGGRHKEVVYYILHHCPDCHEIVDHRGQNIVHFAVQSGSDAMLNHLLNGNNSDDGYLPSMANLINQKDVEGNTPLHLAATYCFDNRNLIGHPLFDKMAVNHENLSPLDVILTKSDEHSIGDKGGTVASLKKAGYEQSQRKVMEAKDTLPKAIDMEEMERKKNAHMIVAALIVTVTFAAGFTLPGGYNGNEGSALLSRNEAFKTFIVTDAMALLLSTCALFFHYSWGADGLSKRRLEMYLDAAEFFIMLAIILMLIAFTAGVYAVLPNSSNIGAAICVITSFFLLICYSPLKGLKKKLWHYLQLLPNIG